jgi:1,4-dihydroxy-2-naphthoyl-CoA synthase
MATITTTQPATGETTKQLINYRADRGVAVIEMNDPPANTYTYEMNRQLDDAILQARMQNDVYVIVLTGVGDKFFSAGANIKMLASVDPTFKYYFCLHANETLLRLEHTPKLVIAAINGHGRRSANRPQRRRQDRIARSQSRRAPRHRRNAAPVAPSRQK